VAIQEIQPGQVEQHRPAACGQRLRYPHRELTLRDQVELTSNLNHASEIAGNGTHSDVIGTYG
jgi:hypothetical protein